MRLWCVNWRNYLDGPKNAPSFTSVFVAPLSQRAYPSGELAVDNSWGGNGVWPVLLSCPRLVKDGVYWYGDKRTAQQAAFAVACRDDFGCGRAMLVTPESFRRLDMFSDALPYPAAVLTDVTRRIEFVLDHKELTWREMQTQFARHVLEVEGYAHVVT